MFSVCFKKVPDPDSRNTKKNTYPVLTKKRKHENAGQLHKDPKRNPPTQSQILGHSFSCAFGRRGLSQRAIVVFISERSEVELTEKGYARTALQNGCGLERIGGGDA